MKYGTFMGIILFIVGGILGAIGFYMLGNTGSTFRILFAGPAISAVGLGMIIFPGADITLKDVHQDKELQRKFFSMSPKLHIAAWVFLGAVALIASFMYIF